jgi:segregation and condensation protein A
MSGSFEVKIEAYNGPMAKLLELIEEKQLEITKVNLATVTADFIAYIESLGEEVMSDVLSDFIVVASRLLLIKSKVLIPNLELTNEEEVDILDLEHRLKLYREFSLKGNSVTGNKSAAQYIKALWDKNEVAYARPYLSVLGDPKSMTQDSQKFFYPSPQITTERLESAMASLLTVLKGLVPETKGVRMTIVTLQEKIAELTSRLSQTASITLKGTVSKKEKGEIIVLFLAVLHMLANKSANVEQAGAFGDIVVRQEYGGNAEENLSNHKE